MPGTNALFGLCLVCAIVLLMLACPSDSRDCEKAEREWLQVKYSLPQMPLQVTELGRLLSVCPSTGGHSCCDRSKEQDIFSVSQLRLSNEMNRLFDISNKMANDSLRFHEYFRQDLSTARSHLDVNFNSIYGATYKDNKHFFFSFFDNLQAYLAGRRGGIRQLLDEFFLGLRTLIIDLMESSMHSKTLGASEISQRVKCMSNKLTGPNAFNNIDQNLREKLLQAYVPARMLVNALATGSYLVKSIIHVVSNNPHCAIAFSRLWYCDKVCMGLVTNSNPCPSQCDNFNAVCFGTTALGSRQLTIAWPRFIDSLSEAAKRFQQPYNFQMVNKNLYMDISEAIMFLQRKFPELKESLEKECGGASFQRAPPISADFEATRMREASKGSGFWSQSGLSAGSTQMNQPSSGYPGDLLSRYKRNRNAKNSLLASPELLKWQDKSYSSRHNPRQSFQGPISPLSEAHLDSSHSYPLHSLNEMTNQLRHSYKPLKDVFSRTLAHLCPSAHQSDPNCRSVPSIDQGTGETSAELLDAANQLHNASEQLLQLAVAPNLDRDTFHVGVRLLHDLSRQTANTDPMMSPHYRPPQRPFWHPNAENPTPAQPHMEWPVHTEYTNPNAPPENKPQSARGYGDARAVAGNYAESFEPGYNYNSYSSSGVPPIGPDYLSQPESSSGQMGLLPNFASMEKQRPADHQQPWQGRQDVDQSSSLDYLPPDYGASGLDVGPPIPIRPSGPLEEAESVVTNSTAATGDSLAMPKIVTSLAGPSAAPEMNASTEEPRPTAHLTSLPEEPLPGRSELPSTSATTGEKDHGPSPGQQPTMAPPAKGHESLPEKSSTERLEPLLPDASILGADGLETGIPEYPGQQENQPTFIGEPSMEKDPDCSGSPLDGSSGLDPRCFVGMPDATTYPEMPKPSPWDSQPSNAAFENSGAPPIDPMEAYPRIGADSDQEGSFVDNQASGDGGMTPESEPILPRVESPPTPEQDVMVVPPQRRPPSEVWVPADLNLPGQVPKPSLFTIDYESGENRHTLTADKLSDSVPCRLCTPSSQLVLLGLIIFAQEHWL